MNKKELVELKKRILSLSLVGTMTLSFVGCSKTDKKNMAENIYSVSYNSENRDDALYKYVLTPKSFISEKYTYSAGDFLYKIESEENYGTNILKLNEKTLAFYRKNMQIVLPDCYNTYSQVWFSDSYFDFDMKKEVILSDFF